MKQKGIASELIKYAQSALAALSSPIPMPLGGAIEWAKCFQNLLIWTNINEIFIKLYNLF